MVKQMKAKEIRDMNAAELDQKLAGLKDELFHLRFQHATGQLENPMRLKGSMLAIAALSVLQASMLVVAILETLNRYVPGWAVPTFMPELLRLIR